MDKKHKVVRRSLVISVVVVPLVLICSAKSEDDSHVHGDRLCHPGTDTCPHQIPNPKHVDGIHSRNSLVEASRNEPKIVCFPNTSKCNNPKINRIISNPTEETGTEKGDDTSSEFKPLNVCDPITHVCPGTHAGSFDAYEKEDEEYASGESKYESSEDSESKLGEASTSKCHKPTNMMACQGPPDHRICTDTHHSSFVADDASAKSQSSESDSSFDTSPPYSQIRMICTGLPNEGRNCSSSPPSFVSESDEDRFVVNVHQEENRISPLVCHPTVDGTKCQGPRHAFGIAQPGVDAS